jgi:hypothetical protein
VRGILLALSGTVARCVCFGHSIVFFIGFHSFQFLFHSILRRKLLLTSNFRFLFKIGCVFCIHASISMFHAGIIPALEYLELYKVINNNRREEISYQKEVSGSCQREGSGPHMP